MVSKQLLEKARVARKEDGSEFRILSGYRSACGDMVRYIGDLSIDVEEIDDVGKTWLYRNRDDMCDLKQRQLFKFWRELMDLLCKIIMKEEMTTKTS